MFNKSWKSGALAVLAGVMATDRAGAEYISLGGVPGQWGGYEHEIHHNGRQPYGWVGMHNGRYAALAAKYLTEMEKAVRECRKADYDHNLRNLMALEEIAKNARNDRYGEIPKGGDAVFHFDSTVHAAEKAERDASEDRLHLQDLRIEAQQWWVGCPQRTAAPPQQVGSSGRAWTGPSFGVETLENFGRVRTTETLAGTGQTTFESTDSGDPLGVGVVVGYTFAPLSNAVLVSPFLSMDFLNQTINHNFAGGAFFGTATHWIGTFGAKVGVAPTSNLFVYGLFGGSVLNEDLNINFGGPVTSQNVTVPGFTSGFGAAFKPSQLQGFGMPVSVFAQYQHTWWADANLNQPAASPFFNYNFRREDDTLRFGVNFQFGAASPPQPSPSLGMLVKSKPRY